LPGLSAPSFFVVADGVRHSFSELIRIGHLLSLASGQRSECLEIIYDAVLYFVERVGEIGNSWGELVITMDHQDTIDG
jgi:hypothetical protein